MNETLRCVAARRARKGERLQLRAAAYLLVGCALLGVFLLVSPADSLASPVGSPAEAPMGQTIPVAMQVQVTLQRPNSPPPSAPWRVPIWLGFYAPGGASFPEVEWIDLWLDESGAYSGILSLAPGTYDVRVKNGHTLRNVRRNVEVTTMTTIDMGTLLEGDADNDNRVRASDFTLLSLAYFTIEGDARFDPRCDFDEDKRVRSSDFALLRANYFRTGDIEIGGTASAVDAAVRIPADAGSPPDVKADASVALALEPAVVQIAPGDTFTLTLTAHAGEQTFVALDADIRFPPASLQVVGPDGTPATTIQVLAPVDNVALNQVDNSAGRILYAAGTPYSADPVSGDVQLAQIRFRALQATSAASVNIADGTVADATGKWVTGPLSGATVQIGSGFRYVYLPLVVRGAR